MKWALVDVNNVIKNVVCHDSACKYEPPAGLKLMMVNDWLNIGQSIDAKEPEVVVETPELLKARRNEDKSKDLTFVGLYLIESTMNPGLSFSDYLDKLEKTEIKI
jgi:hypothetical protein